MNRYTICHFISNRPTPEGYIFDSRDYPLHITQVGGFLDATPQETICNQLGAIASSAQSFDALVGAYADLGLNGEVPVYRIKPNQVLIGLHNAIVAQLRQNSAEFRNPTFLNKGYKPHATIQKTELVETGDIVPIQSFSLVAHEPDGIPHERIILKTFLLSR